MQVFVPTRNRETSITGRRLSEAGIPFLYVFTEGATGIKEICDGRTVKAAHIGEKRQRILELAGNDKFVMLDDDLSLFRRVTAERFEPATNDDIRFMFACIDAALDYTALVGIVPRFWAQSHPRGLIRHGRFDQVLAYNPAKFREPKPSFRPPVAEEHDFNLQLISQGHAPIVLTEFCKNDKRYAPGGCNSWRTPEIELQGLQFVVDQWSAKYRACLKPDQKTLSGQRLALGAGWKRIVPPHDDLPWARLEGHALSLISGGKW